MKQIIKLTTIIKEISIDRQADIEIRCALPDAEELVIAFFMLYEKLIDSFVVFDTKGKKVEILLSWESTVRAVIARKPNKIEIGLPIVAIDTIIHFYLIYLRDSLADVSHIDVETNTGNYVTFFAANSKLPLSAKDAEAHLHRKL